MNIKEEWEKKRRKIWQEELKNYDEDACEQLPEEESPICTKASPASRGEWLREKN